MLSKIKNPLFDHYHTNLTIQYTNTNEYRKCIRQIFIMNPAKYPTIMTDVDPESRDELEYDEDAASKMMDFVYDRTKKNPLFQVLYDKGAGRMLSMDREIGLTILFSYDYLDVFYPCFIAFLLNPNDFTDTSLEYLAVLNRFVKLNNK